MRCSCINNSMREISMKSSFNLVFVESVAWEIFFTSPHITRTKKVPEKNSETERERERESENGTKREMRPFQEPYIRDSLIKGSPILWYNIRYLTIESSWQKSIVRYIFSMIYNSLTCTFHFYSIFQKPVSSLARVLNRPDQILLEKSTLKFDSTISTLSRTSKKN